MTLLDVLIEGLTAVGIDEKSSPGPSTPVALIAARGIVLRELEDRLPADGDGPFTVTRSLGPVRSYRAEVDLLRRRGGFSLADAACALLAVGALTDDDVAALLPHLPASCGIGRQRVLNRLADDDLGAARAAADRIRGDTGWKGHRDIAAVLADRGDAAEFLAGWKSYRAATDRHGMGELKRRLVEGVARTAGWAAALELVGDKRFGPALAVHAFTAFGADVDGLRRVLGRTGVLAELDQLAVLSSAVLRASGTDPVRNHPYLDELVDRIIAVDPSADRATMRTRDRLLFSLWPAMGETATLDRVRRAVRTPQYRRELTRLPRDLTASLRH
ncbi:hypothetical protein ACWT_3205 [Actinoplanes sp. SE50]|uniref:hypothetical protein n=1 Tax=unclassified Actinoplanes TaxID=2626549 RepID=UPI00023EC954|nr:MULTISPECIES: hypothetical protein [unclassified Actinoplanes]AEV84228.1 hypothetical protein ACPL_3333 [Actinoplanes sp. SE50/110]ATO82620.1 hypothetical protein ACWT_3205 [Actinoplanes sp. SE50]SLM00027.1 hypothetical protein ACSP50_3259 [Actinoplanes sp. SE50/110]